MVMAKRQIPSIAWYLGRATVHETMHGMLWLGGRLSRLIDVTRLLDEARLLRATRSKPSRMAL